MPPIEGSGSVTSRSGDKSMGRQCAITQELLGARPFSTGFTLAEILVVMALLSFIVLGLMAMFNQTQRAFRAGLMQTDILESGRLATDLLGRELEEITPSYSSNYFAPSFFTELKDLGGAQYYSIQALPSLSGNSWRTNVMNDVFLVTHENKTWTGIGYFARTNRLAGTNAGAVCTLYRYEWSRTDEQFRTIPYQMFTNFEAARSTTNNLPTVSRIMDGVVHFRVRPCDDEGWVIPYNPAWYTNFPNSFPVVVTNGLLRYSGPDVDSGEYLSYRFLSNTIPAFVELEIGILEQQTLERYRSFPVPNSASAQYFTSPQWKFFSSSAVTAHTHLFRQRVAVRNIDSSAYLK